MFKKQAIEKRIKFLENLNIDEIDRELNNYFINDYSSNSKLNYIKHLKGLRKKAINKDKLIAKLLAKLQNQTIFNLRKF